MREKTFTPTDQAVLDFIKKFKDENDGNSPSHREIIEGTSIMSTGHLTFVLEKLEQFGRINVKKGHRSITILG